MDDEKLYSEGWGWDKTEGHHDVVGNTAQGDEHTRRIGKRRPMHFDRMGMQRREMKERPY